MVRAQRKAGNKVIRSRKLLALSNQMNCSKISFACGDLWSTREWETKLWFLWPESKSRINDRAQYQRMVIAGSLLIYQNQQRKYRLHFTVNQPASQRCANEYQQNNDRRTSKFVLLKRVASTNSSVDDQVVTGLHKLMNIWQSCSIVFHIHNMEQLSFWLVLLWSRFLLSRLNPVFFFKQSI